MRIVDDGLGTIHIYTGTKSNGKQFQELRKDFRYLEQEIVDLKIEITDKDKEIKRLNNIINELKLCNSDYYNMVNTCTSKLSRIRDRASYEETNAENLSEDILAIIDEKEICLKPIENNIKGALEFIDRYLSLDLDEFNTSSLLTKLREILKRGEE